MATEKSNDKATEKAQSDRSKALDTALAQIERQFGKGSVMKMSERQNQVVEVIPTGSIGLDIALGIGGLPRGRVVEIYGPESSGKTTLTLHAIANAQKAGGICAFIDAEHAFDAAYAKKLGVDTDNLLISQPDSSTMRLIFFPPGPMSRPIFSGLIFISVIRGAYLLMSARASGRVVAMCSRIFRRAAWARLTVSAMIGSGSPRSLRSS